MSLAVWLPLNGNLKNYGLAGVHGVNHSASSNSSGKIGSCYSFNGSNSISIAKVILPSNTPEWSFACWFYLNDVSTTTATCLFSERKGTNSNGYTIFIYPNNSKVLIDDGTRWEITPMIFNATTWYHLVVTRDTTGKKIYINGELKGSTSTVGTTTAINANGCLIGLAQSGTALATGNQGLKGKLNDVRIYTNCLSTKEVEELSKALVLHYKLDSIEGNKVYDCSGYLHNGTITGTAILDNTSPRYNNGIYMNNTSSANHILCDTVITLPTNGITVSFWAYTTKTNTYVLYIDLNMSFAVNSAGTGFYVNRSSGAGFPITEFKANLWNHVVLIRNGSTYKAYINGILITASLSNNNWSHNVSNIYLLNRSYNNNYAANASISDFRMYATELTEDLILDLYHTSASIDNIGNIYSREYVENDNLSITKTGLFLCDAIHDDNNLTVASILKNSELILGYSLYEF